jgi:hypothetical protein
LIAGTLRSAMHPQRSRLILSAWLALSTCFQKITEPATLRPSERGKERGIGGTSCWCPFENRSPRTDDEYFEVLAAAVFSARFNPDIVRARWPSIRKAFAGFDLRSSSQEHEFDAELSA